MALGQPPTGNWHMSEASWAFFNHGVHQESEDRRIWGKGYRRNRTALWQKAGA